MDTQRFYCACILNNYHCLHVRVVRWVGKGFGWNTRLERRSSGFVVMIAGPYICEWIPLLNAHTSFALLHGDLKQTKASDVDENELEDHNANETEMISLT
ncbi:hypothetical protein KXD40_004327 [Peronospora effusa]|uniref:Uncharacterized protein n=1 Tax=Peronospora effusa TaxID=542832 RepID=A0A425CGQ7_9STRA|nr:hypothetical protein DD237_004322 [Peronospora effusa]UIZ27861.1 hypothetical protein KXD40_004327 [Peronospora effusa]